MDWWQVLYSFIGGFLGFGFALLTESLVNKKKGKIERKKVNDNLLDELMNIMMALNGNEDKQKPIVFDTPVWQSIITTGMLLSLLEEDKDKYNEIMIIYNRIYALKIAENSSNYLIVEELRKEIVENIKCFGNSIRGEI